VCDERDYKIEYNGNKYSKWFYYPNPIEHMMANEDETVKEKVTDLVKTKKDYGYCQE
jgi:hypothetical protein